MIIVFRVVYCAVNPNRKETLTRTVPQFLHE
ncbi:unnamed protein product, partial [Brachionus calyciflorus]